MPTAGDRERAIQQQNQVQHPTILSCRVALNQPINGRRWILAKDSDYAALARRRRTGARLW